MVLCGLTPGCLFALLSSLPTPDFCFSNIPKLMHFVSQPSIHPSMKKWSRATIPGTGNTKVNKADSFPTPMGLIIAETERHT